MTPHIRLLLVATLLAVLAAPSSVAVGGDIRPALAPTPNSAIILYRPPADGKPGRAVVGTLVDGVYTKKGAFTTGRWTSIAVGRDSMALYDKATGKLLTGRFRNGVWKPAKSRTIAKGYSHVVASCDSIAFYKRSTGTGRSAEFTSGDIRDVRRLTGLEEGFSQLAASCDSLMAQGPGLFPTSQVGWLRDGHYRPNQDDVGFGWTHLTASRTSYIRLFVPTSGTADGDWGRLLDGRRHIDGEASTFALWDIVAGAGDSVLFYMRSTGSTWGARLEDGVYSDAAPRPSVGKGWRIIAGGK